MPLETSREPNPAEALGGADAARLLETARRAITSRLSGGRDEGWDDVPDSSPLAARRASFVTLRRAGELRGCIGSLEADARLIENVWRNAQRAAFEDRRFSPLGDDEITHLEIHISVLSSLEPMTIASQADLIAQLRPGVDGLLIEERHHRATFLPDVWASLPDARSFLEQLKQKAGLAREYWSADLRAWRYRTHSYE